MTWEFSRWAAKKNIPGNVLYKALQEVQTGNFEANFSGHIYKKRKIKFIKKGAFCFERVLENFGWLVKRENRNSLRGWRFY